jgi:hypothetical protein
MMARNQKIGSREEQNESKLFLIIEVANFVFECFEKS